MKIINRKITVLDKLLLVFLCLSGISTCQAGSGPTINFVVPIPSVTSRNWLECPNWYGCKSLLLELAMDSDVDITITEDKGWIRTTYFFSIKGTEAQIEKFDRNLIKIVNKLDK